MVDTNNGKSFVGGGALPEGKLISEAELTSLLNSVAALSEEEEQELRGVSVETPAAPLGQPPLGQPVSVDISRFPFRAVVYLDIFLDGGLRRRGSAFFVTPNVLATAGHNLRFQFAGVGRIDVIVDLQGNLALARRYTAEHYETHPDFTPNVRDFDVGIVRLVEDVGSVTGFFGLADADSVNTPIQVDGYPESSFFQSASAGSIQSATATRLSYDAATFNGQSGGVVFIPNISPVDIVAVGVHTNGIISGDTFNSGVRMSDDVRDWIVNFA